MFKATFRDVCLHPLFGTNIEQGNLKPQGTSELDSIRRTCLVWMLEKVNNSLEWKGRECRERSLNLWLISDPGTGSETDEQCWHFTTGGKGTTQCDLGLIW